MTFVSSSLCVCHAVQKELSRHQAKVIGQAAPVQPTHLSVVSSSFCTMSSKDGDRQ